MSSTAPAQPGAGPNPFDSPAFRANPYAFYAMLRANNPVFRPPIPGHEGAGVAILTRFADVETALRDERFSVERQRADVVRQYAAFLPPQIRDQVNGFQSMLTKDAPDHTRLRGLVSRAFTPRRVETLRPRIEALVAELLEPVMQRGAFDVMGDFAEPLPAIVIAELLGVPAEDHRAFKAMSSELVNGGPAGRGLRPGAQDAAATTRGFERITGYMRDILAKRRASPRDDLLSALLEARDERDALSEPELVSSALLLLVAGHETTTNLIGNGLTALLREPDQWQRLRAEPELLENGIEELLRFDSPVQATIRVTREDVPLPGGEIPAGALAVCVIGAANRDPEVFAEPDRLDVARADVRHLSFGFGAHFCLGAGLARLEARIAFAALLERFPRLGLAIDTPEYRPNPILRGLSALPVRF